VSPAPGAPPGRRLTGAFIAGILTASALGGFLIQRLTTPHPLPLRPLPLPPSRQLPQPAPAGSPAAAPEAPPARRIPEKLPDVALADMSGTVRHLSAFKGHLLLVNFWATWCEPCRREMPLLQKISRERAKDGVEIVGIALDQREDVAKFAATMHVSYPLLIGDQGGFEAASAFGMEPVLPFSVFADRSGQIVTLKVGELHPDEAALILDTLVRLDAGGMPLAAAREEISSGIARLTAARAAGTPPAQP